MTSERAVEDQSDWSDFQPTTERDHLAYSLMTAGITVDPSDPAAVERGLVNLDYELADMVLDDLHVRGLALAAARGETLEDAVDLAALLYDNDFSWDDANAVNAILTHHELVVLRAATPSPTPPEGRAALVLAHSMLHSGEQPTRQSEDIIHAALLTSPAPDPGAGLVDTERGIARHAIVQASIHLANGDLVGAHEDLTVALVALAPSAEPPETET